MIPPDAHAFSLAQRNFDAIAQDHRAAWHHAFRRARRGLVPMPERVIIEIANTCNLDCPMCRVGEHGVNLERVMPIGQFADIARALLPTARDVRLNGLGETTLVPGFRSYLDVLERFSVNLELITNGTGSAAAYERIVTSGGTILFSWDAASPARFEALRRGARYTDIAATVRAVSEAARLSGRRDGLHLLFTLQPANRSDLPAVVEMAAELDVANVVVNVAKLRDVGWQAEHRDDVLSAFADAERVAARCAVRLFLPDRFGNDSVPLRSAMPTSASGCDRPWKEVVIRWNLDVQVCNMFNPYVYGNLHLRSFPSIWEGAFAAAFRENVNTSACHPYCRGCAYIGDVYARKHA